MKKLQAMVEGFLGLFHKSTYNDQDGKITGCILAGSPSSRILGEGIGQVVCLMTPQDGYLLQAKTRSEGNARVVQCMITNVRNGSQYWWSIELAIPEGKWVVGEFPNAQLYPCDVTSRPGLNFTGCGQGNRFITGEFAVHEITLHNEEVATIAVDAVQWDAAYVRKGRHIVLTVGLVMADHQDTCRAMITVVAFSTKLS